MTGPAPDPQRFHLTVSSTGGPVMHGWWSRETTARDKYRDWIGAYGRMPAAHIRLVERLGAADERLLESWPADTPPAHHRAGTSPVGTPGPDGP
ncbi:hypothetical protein ABZ307_29240 [Streptomyces griseorubiginosus]|uniref:hypothetical protein n=1 Tax=Streptomyces griseorubiginosus TaxID=67304 RepID=UPI0033B987F2